MRFLFTSLAVAAMAPLASAQQVGLIGPSMPVTSVNGANFDTQFDVVVPAWPTSPLLRNQPKDARFDAIVCNTDATRKGAVRVDAQERWGYLDPGVCTMFANFAQLNLSRPDGEYEWIAKVYLRAKR